MTVTPERSFVGMDVELGESAYTADIEAARQHLLREGCFPYTIHVSISLCDPHEHRHRLSLTGTRYMTPREFAELQARREVDR